VEKEFVLAVKSMGERKKKTMELKVVGKPRQAGSSNRGKGLST